MLKPKRPHPDYPLGAWPNGQWGNKIKGKPYYFGSWSDDPNGATAIKDYKDRLPSILAGTDHLRHLSNNNGSTTVADLMREYLAHCLTSVNAGTMSQSTFGDYCY